MCLEKVHTEYFQCGFIVCLRWRMSNQMFHSRVSVWPRVSRNGRQRGDHPAIIQSEQIHLRKDYGYQQIHQERGTTRVQATHPTDSEDGKLSLRRPVGGFQVVTIAHSTPQGHLVEKVHIITGAANWDFHRCPPTTLTSFYSVFLVSGLSDSFTSPHTALAFWRAFCERIGWGGAWFCKLDWGILGWVGYYTC